MNAKMPTPLTEANMEKMRFRFAAPVKQIDETTFEILVKRIEAPMFDGRFVDAIEAEMGRQPAAEVLDRMVDEFRVKQLSSLIRPV